MGDPLRAGDRGDAGESDSGLIDRTGGRPALCGRPRPRPRPRPLPDTTFAGTAASTSASLSPSAPASIAAGDGAGAEAGAADTAGAAAAAEDTGASELAAATLAVAVACCVALSPPEIKGVGMTAAASRCDLGFERRRGFQSARLARSRGSFFGLAGSALSSASAAAAGGSRAGGGLGGAGGGGASPAAAAAGRLDCLPALALPPTPCKQRLSTTCCRAPPGEANVSEHAGAFKQR